MPNCCRLSPVLAKSSYGFCTLEAGMLPRKSWQAYSPRRLSVFPYIQIFIEVGGMKKFFLLIIKAQMTVNHKKSSRILRNFLKEK
jgi:hypothetical protein